MKHTTDFPCYHTGEIRDREQTATPLHNAKVYHDSETTYYWIDDLDDSLKEEFTDWVNETFRSDSDIENDTHPDITFGEYIPPTTFCLYEGSNLFEKWDHVKQTWINVTEEFFGTENPDTYADDPKALKDYFVDLGWMSKDDIIEVI